MKKTNITITMLCLAAACACGDIKITWLADVTVDRAETVTGAQSNAVAAAAAHIPRADNPHGVTAAQIGAITAELDPVANAALVVHTNRADNPHNVTAVQIGALIEELDPVANAKLVVHTNRADNPHSVTAVQIGALTAELDPVAGPRLDRIEVGTNAWQTAYGWGDHAAVGYLLPAALTPYATTAALVIHTNRIDNPHSVTAAQIGAITAELDPVANAAIVVHTNRIDNPHNVTASQIGALTAELDPVANAALVIHTNRIDNPHGVTAVQIGAITAEADPVSGPRLDRIEPATNKWNEAYGWGDHAAVGYLLPAALAPYATTTALAAHTNRNDNPHNVTAPQIGALTAEQDLVALAADRFLPIDAGKNVISTDAGSGSIVTYSALIGDRAGNSITGANVVAIGRDAARKAILATGEEEADVIAIGENAAEEAGQLYAVSNVIAIGDSAFKGASGVRAIAIGDDAGFAADMQYGIAVGQFAGYGATLVNSIVIGTGAGSQSSLANSVVIGPSAGEKATGDGMLFIDGSGHGVTDHPEYAMIYGSNVNLTLGKGGAWPYSTNVLRGNWLLNNSRILTNEQDLAALRAYHYGSPDIVESPAEWFIFNGAGTITAFNWEAGRTNVVIPWAIGGVPVTAIGGSAFTDTGAYSGFPVTSVIAPQTVTVIGSAAFADCPLLVSVIAPQAQTVGDSAFNNCTSLASALLPQATAIGDFTFADCSALTSVHMGRNAPAEAAYVFAGITPPPTVYVTDPQATGWGATWNGAPVVRPPLYGSNVTAQAFTLGGDTITEWPSSSVPYTAWTGTVTPVGGTATITAAHGNMPVLVVPDGPGITYVTIATGTYAATSGVSRVSLSIWAGINTIELVTNEVDYATAPDIPTDGWGTILFRRVSNGRWKGVGL